MTGFPWSRGQILSADDLNAAFVGGTGKAIVAPTPPVPLNNPDGTLWWSSTDGQLYVLYHDGTSMQWVAASGAVPPGGGPFLPLSGGTVTGRTDFTGGFTSAYPGTANKLYSTPTHPSAAYVSDQSQLFSYYVAAAASGTIGQVSSNARLYSSITGAPDQYIFNLISVVDYAGSGGHGQQVASYNQALRRNVNAGGSANNPEIFGGVFEVVDFTGVDSNQTNTMNGIEVDMTCGGPDTAGTRRGFGMYVNTVGGAVGPAVVNTGVHIAANVGSYNTMINLQSTFNTAAIDLRNANAATGTAHQIWLGTAGTIALDTPASFTLSGDTTGGMIMASVAGQPSRIVFQPGSVASFWTGVWADGNYYVSGPGGNAITVAPGGAITLGGAVTGTTAAFNLGGFSSPSGNDPLSVTTTAGHYARILYNVSGVRMWSGGGFPDGSWRLSDETGGVPRLSVLTNGNVLMTNSFAIANKTPPTIPTGYTAPTGTATRATFATGSVTLPQLAERVKALIDDLTLYGLIGP